MIGRFNRISRLQGTCAGMVAVGAVRRVAGERPGRLPRTVERVDAESILLIGTRHDPNTPYRNAVRAQRLLGNAVLLTHNGYGHLSYQDPSACVELARVDYLVNVKRH